MASAAFVFAAREIRAQVGGTGSFLRRFDAAAGSGAGVGFLFPVVLGATLIRAAASSGLRRFPLVFMPAFFLAAMASLVLRARLSMIAFLRALMRM